MDYESFSDEGNGGPKLNSLEIVLDYLGIKGEERRAIRDIVKYYDSMRENPVRRYDLRVIATDEAIDKLLEENLLFQDLDQLDLGIEEDDDKAVYELNREAIDELADMAFEEMKERELNDITLASLCQYLGFNSRNSRGIRGILNRFEDARKKGIECIGRYVFETLVSCSEIDILVEKGVLETAPYWKANEIMDKHRSPYRLNRERLFELIEEAEKTKKVEIENEGKTFFSS